MSTGNRQCKNGYCEFDQVIPTNLSCKGYFFVAKFAPVQILKLTEIRKQKENYLFLKKFL